MTELNTRKEQTLSAIESAADADALEALRVEALGKQGWISQLLKTLGKMTPEERQEKAPAIQQARSEVADAIARRKHAMDDAELDRKLATETLDLSLPAPISAQG